MREAKLKSWLCWHMPVILARGTGNQRSSGPALTVCGVGNQSLGYVRVCLKKQTNNQKTKCLKKDETVAWSCKMGVKVRGRVWLQRADHRRWFSSGKGAYHTEFKLWTPPKGRRELSTYFYMYVVICPRMHTSALSYAHMNALFPQQRMHEERKKSNIGIGDCSLFWLRCATELFPFVKCTVLCTQDNWHGGLVHARRVPFCCDTFLGPQQGCDWGQESSFTCGKW